MDSGKETSSGTSSGKSQSSGIAGNSKSTQSSNLSGENNSEANSLNKTFSDIIDAFAGSKDEEKNPKKGIPPQGLNTKSFYDEKGNFKSYYDGKLPEEFLTKTEHFTDPHKMQDDIYYKKSKMFWHQDAEREEFKKFHDWRGKDRKAYQKLLDDHARAQEEANEKNRETWIRLKREYYNYDSELR